LNLIGTSYTIHIATGNGGKYYYQLPRLYLEKERILKRENGTGVDVIQQTIGNRIPEVQTSDAAQQVCTILRGCALRGLLSLFTILLEYIYRKCKLWTLRSRFVGFPRVRVGVRQLRYLGYYPGHRGFTWPEV